MNWPVFFLVLLGIPAGGVLIAIVGLAYERALMWVLKDRRRMEIAKFLTVLAWTVGLAALIGGLAA